MGAAGSDVAIETAGNAILVDDLTRLPDAIETAAGGKLDSSTQPSL